MNLNYLRYELLRLVRNKRAFFFSLVFPLLLFVVIGGSNKNEVLDLGTQKMRFVVYYMVSMASYGAMIAATSGGARIASERQVGWTRQLRITPLRVRDYFATKVVSTYVMVVVSIAVLYVAGALYGVRIEALRWVEMTGLLLIGVLPFVAMGIAIGHLLTIDSMGPAVGGGSALFGFLGGQWFPLPEHGSLRALGELLPSYWLAQASRVGTGADGWGLKGWLVIAVWSVATAGAAAWAYRRDTNRV